MFKVIYDKPSSTASSNSPPLEFSETELQAMNDLMSLWEEGHTDDDGPSNIALSGGVISGVSFPPPVSFKPKSRVIFF